MADVTVYFLGEEYNVPEELKEFIGYLHHFENIHNNLMPLLTSQMQRKEYSGGADEDFVYFKTPLSKVGKRIITELAKKNIYDVTLDDVVYNNKGYIQLHNVCKETMQGMINILMNAMQSWSDGYQNAYSSAASTITGSGVTIWTNSLSSALIYSALEASTIKKQADKADKQYREAIGALNRRTEDAQEKQKTELLVNKYYPGVAEALGLFVSEMMEYYVNKLEQNGIFDYSKVKRYDLRRSSDLLKNITIVPDKAGLLKKAFAYCPYNPDVYNAVLESGLADVPTFETAKYFMQDGVLVEAIEKYAESNIANVEAVKVPVQVLALYKGESESSIWKSLYSDEYMKLHRYYGKVGEATKSRYSLGVWIKNNITDDAVKLCAMDSETIARKVKSVFDKKVISDSLFSLFKELGMLDQEFSVPATGSLDEVNAAYAGAVIEAISKIIPEIKINVDKYGADADSAKQTYESARRAFEAKQKELQDEEANLKQQRSALGLFSFSKKKELDAKIVECQQEMDTLKKSDHTQKLKRDYERLYDKVRSLDIF
ncbi:MAG: hypothetical protein LUD79_02640 [Oscillospiraceae bacterium]|nr:hypothetical protein [Oscillospiraceae bacterium]